MMDMAPKRELSRSASSQASSSVLPTMAVRTIAVVVCISALGAVNGLIISVSLLGRP